MQTNFNDGIHNISNDEYHNSDGLSRSALWLFKKAPAYYYHRYINPDYVDHKTNNNLIMGNLVHTLSLEPHLFDKEFVVKPTLPELPKAGLLKDLGREEFDKQKDARARVVASNKILSDAFDLSSKQKQVITSDVYNTAKKIAGSILQNDFSRSLIENSKIEQSIYWTHEDTGIQCKARPDAWFGSMIIDVKTTADASHRAFQASAYSYGYFLQAGMIKEAMKSIGVEMEKFIILSVEKTEPYATATFILDDESIQYGVDLFNKLMHDFKQCQDDGKWPAYPLQTLSLPAYANKEEL
jgi:hypothetical protein